MGSFGSAALDELVNRVTGGNNGNPESLWFHKTDRRAGVAISMADAGAPYSLWEFDGQPSGGAVPPTTAAAPDNTTAGSLRQTNPGGGRQKWAHAAGAGFSRQHGAFVIYDRLLHISGLSGTVTSPQTVGGSITRYTGSESYSNEVWAEIYTQIGATVTNITASYTDQDGNSGITSTATTIGGAGNRDATRMIQLSLTGNDTGVRAVASVTLAATTGTAGNFGIVIARPLFFLPVFYQGGGGALIGVPDILPEIKTDACLAVWWMAGNITNTSFSGFLNTVER